MRTETIEIYKFVELSDEGKERARDWWRTGMDYSWTQESMNSIVEFCKEFGVMVQEWSINPYERSWVETNAANESFRGVRLKSVKRDAMPTGYCLDCTLWMTFHDEFKRTGSALLAFNEAIDAAVAEVQSDMEYQLTDEAVNEMLEINEYEFTADGRIH